MIVKAIVCTAVVTQKFVLSYMVVVTLFDVLMAVCLGSGPLWSHCHGMSCCLLAF